MKEQLAASIPLGQLRGQGPLGLEGYVLEASPSVFSLLLSTIVGVMTVIAFIWFVIQFLLGAVGIISSGGDKAALESARKKLTTGIIGLIVVISAIFLIDLIGAIMGVDLLGVASFINTVAP